MKLKRFLVAGALTIATVAGLASCGSKNDKGLVVCLASTPDQMDPALNSAVDGASYAVHAFGGLVRYVPGDNGELKLAPDLCTELPTAQTISSGDDAGKVSYTFTLRDDILFSDGTAITAKDFVWSWNRAASYSVKDDKGTDDESDDVIVLTGLDGDYNYMFDVIDGYYSLTKDSKQEDVKDFLNVTAKDDRTLQVVLPVDVPYFLELCAFPTYMVLKEAAVGNDTAGAWAKNPATFITSGAYKMTKYQEDVEITFVKNENYWDAKNITVEKITFALNGDDTSTMGAYDSGEYKFIQSYPQSMISKLKTRSDFYTKGQLGTYYVSWNINASVFSTMEAQQAADVRTAISLLLDRTYICEAIAAGGQTPSTGYIPTGLTDPQGGEFVDHNGLNGDGSGYLGDATKYNENVAKAKELLGKWYTLDANGKMANEISLEYITNEGTGHEAIAQYIQEVLKPYGFNVTIDKQEWNTFLETRKQGNYTVARNGWLGDYNDPISFLDMWVTGGGNNDCQLGAGAHASVNYTIDTEDETLGVLSGTWAETYDVLINAIKTSSDSARRYKLMHKAEDLLMSTGAVTPIYNYVDTYLQSSDLTNVYTSPLGYKYFMWSELK